MCFPKGRPQDFGISRLSHFASSEPSLLFCTNMAERSACWLADSVVRVRTVEICESECSAQRQKPRPAKAALSNPTPPGSMCLASLPLTCSFSPLAPPSPHLSLSLSDLSPSCLLVLKICSMLVYFLVWILLVRFSSYDHLFSILLGIIGENSNITKIVQPS